ncbi:hypothetical protein BGZ61DRAFT_458675 [Ilyonectria robusta]|uniref:uncharacterized protein n=1 Tax=Ilyonectria robusta TaxID=1079257 RepID=UPI001E8CF744|nr:uncharacterized protein BGZ61DRAFT_458675 [Ilyonectria robusta]KAH8673019.1 hypothetical protein BGZ61DRAFT_458675 [Ilyonectria robusta]
MSSIMNRHCPPRFPFPACWNTLSCIARPKPRPGSCAVSIIVTTLLGVPVRARDCPETECVGRSRRYRGLHGCK